MSTFFIRTTIFASLLIYSLTAISQTWNPKPGWKDSYAVGGKCYCDSNGYDHGLDTKVADTPIGVQNVVSICETIERVLGEGPTEGRIPYNDIQCGNGPANDAADEAGCPGRVDIGPAGCNQIGPKWDLEAAYAGVSNPSDSLDNSQWVVTASHNSNETNLMLDDNYSSRWTTGTKQADDQRIIIDFTQSIEFNKIVLDSSSSPNDYARIYTLQVSSNGTNWSNILSNITGSTAVLTLEFNTQNKRYIRILQKGASSTNWWSIHELDIYNEQSNPQNPNNPVSGNSGETPWISGIISHLLDENNNQ